MSDYILVKHAPFKWEDVRCFVIYEGGSWIFTIPDEAPPSPIIFGVRLKDGRSWNVHTGWGNK